MASVKDMFVASVEDELSMVKIELVGFAVSRVKAAPMELDVLFAVSPSFRVILICTLVE